MDAVVMSTSELRTLAREAEARLDWAEAARLYSEAAEAYPRHYPKLGELAEADIARLLASAAECAHAARHERGSAMHPNKQHDGKTITIKANERCLDHGEQATGVYTHFAHKSLFGFVPTSGPWVGRDQVLSRDEWDVVTES